LADSYALDIRSWSSNWSRSWKPRNIYLFLVGGKDFFLFKKFRPSTQSPSRWVSGAVSSGIRRSMCEVNRSAPCIEKVKII